ncbi:hypothetical protein R1sor_026878 [Riccia sorocarpa]|uniref:Dirigent protein n=1 Tax=Riccia sorocarpa TaxID=122646 RepID=A0ABD3GFY7_9MARC
MALLKFLVLEVTLTLLAICSSYSTVDAVGYADHPYNFHPPRLPKPDFKFTFYMQSRGGLNGTNRAVTLPVDRVDRLNLTDQSWFRDSNSSFFGTIGVFENPLTLEDPSNSTQVGFGRGIYVFDRKVPVGAPFGSNGVEWLWTAIFNEKSGLANSTLCIKGWNLERESVIGTGGEVAICGGTGKFRALLLIRALALPM